MKKIRTILPVFILAGVFIFFGNNVQAAEENQEEMNTEEIKGEMASIFQKVEAYNLTKEEVISSKEENINRIASLSELSIKAEEIISNNELAKNTVKESEKGNAGSFFMEKFISNVKSLLISN